MSGFQPPSGYSLIQDEGVPLPRHQILNFTGAGVTVGTVGNVTTANIPGGGVPSMPLPNGFEITWRNAANTANVGGMLVDASDQLSIGFPGGTAARPANVLYDVDATGAHTWFQNGVQIANLESSHMSIGPAATVATDGILRLTRNGAIKQRNGGDTADKTIAEVAGDFLFLGADSLGADQVDQVEVFATNIIDLVVASNTIMRLIATNVTINQDTQLADTKAFIAGITNPAQVGAFRSRNNQLMSAARNAANTNNIAGMSVDATDILKIGDQTIAGTRPSNMTFDIATGGTYRFRVNGVDVYTINATDVSYGSRNIITTGNIQLGTNPATIGEVRLGNLNEINSRNNANTADVSMMYVGGTNNLFIGDLNTGAIRPPNMVLAVAAAGTFNFTIGGTQEFNISATTIDGANNDFQTTGNALLGATPRATIGQIRVPNATTIIAARNAANTADISVLATTAGNAVTMAAAGGITLQNAVTMSSSLTVTGNIAIAASVANFQLSQNNTGTPNPFTLRAQGSNAGNTNGGQLLLQGGKRNGTGLRGGFRLDLNVDDTTPEPMVEGVEIATGRRATALNFGAAITTTQLPANSGDLVTFLGSAATAPTASPVGGCLIFATAGEFSFRNSTGDRIIFQGAAATANLGAGVLPATPQEFLTITFNGNVRKIPLYLT
jgi:hypothetical protein